MKKRRLDELTVEKGLFETRSSAQKHIMSGYVKVKDEVIFKPGKLIDKNAEISLLKPRPFVSRGGDKLDKAIKSFQIQIEGLVCADAGSSTGGFTDCLLQNGAKKVYAIDVGKGILHWKLRQDPRVIIMEESNVRYLSSLPEPINLVTIDVSFISLELILPVISRWFEDGSGSAIVLIKPQFEAGKQEVSRGKGVIRDLNIHVRVLGKVLNKSQSLGYSIHGLIKSPIQGPKGNIEYLAYLKFPGINKTTVDGLINQVVDFSNE